jgi:tetratricopeptide (TPR) repeat protein
VPALLVSCYLNAATCALKVQKAERAVKLATKAIAIDGTSVKAFFRRGSAHMQLQNWSEAKADLKQASTLDPKSKEVRDAFNECTQKESAAKKSEKALYGRMFG